MEKTSADKPSTVLVLGGTGKVGSHVVRLLLERKQSVRVLVHSRERAALVPSGAEAWIGDVLEDPDAARPVFDGVDSVFMLNAATLHETVEGLMVVSMAKAAGVKQFVYQSSHSLSQLHHVPHLGAKLAIQEAVRSSGMAYTILSPNLFFQFDEDILDALTGYGTYLNPFGEVGCWRVDVRDIAEAAAIVLTSEGHAGKNYALVGPENLTASQCAQNWQEALGRPVRLGEVGEFQAVLRPYLPAWLLDDLTVMFADISSHGMLGNAEEVGTLSNLLGRAPRSYADYVSDRAALLEDSGSLASS
jgi:uncharacterized protein YbjT (DUF2867 family)